MSNIVPFDSGNFPSHFADDAFVLNASAEEFASVKFPVIAAKNGRFFIKRDGENTLILRPKSKDTDPDEPASYIDMTVLNVQKSKTFYASGYTEGSVEKPDCFSNDGVTPDASAEDAQCATCALCPHNAWGSGVDEKGVATKGKACSDVQRLAIAAPSNLDEPFLFRIPPASLKNFAEVSKFLTSKRVPLNGAVIRFSFDAEKTGVLLFQAIGGLDAETYAAAKSKMNDDLVLAIVGKRSGAAALAVPAKPALSVVKKAAPVTVDPAIAEAKAKADAKAKKLAAAQAALKALEDGDDDEAAVVEVKPEVVAPVVEAKAKGKTKATVTTSDSFNDELNNLLA